MNEYDYIIVNDILEKHYIHKDEKTTYTKAVKENIERITYSQSEFRNDVTDEESFKRITGRQWKKNLGTLIAMIDVYKYVSGREHIYALPISQNGALRDIYKTQRNVFSAITLAERVDLLKCVDDTYQFGAFDESYNKSKCYIMNKNVQDLIISLSSKYQITHKIFKHNKTYNDNKDIIYNSIHLREYNIKINSGLRLSIPFATDEQIIEHLNTIYPQLNDYAELANEINEKYYNNEKYALGIKFEPRVKRSKGGLITKISIRATNGICSLKDHDNGKNTNKIWRKDMLKDYFDSSDYLTFDVKSSIYRITHFLNYNVWLDNDIDLYEEMYGKKFDNAEQRTKYKAFAMRLYFDKSIGTLWNHITQQANELKDDYDKTLLQFELTKMRNKMVDNIGDTYDSEIFLHESCIYMDLAKELLDMGFDLVQVYDGFYVNKTNECKDNESFENICITLLDKIILKYKSKYIK